MPKIAVGKNKYDLGFPVPGYNSSALQIYELESALNTNFETDAHAVLYTGKDLQPGQKQARVQKASAKQYPHELQLELFMADCDNPEHAPWTEESLKAHIEHVARSDLTDGLGIYYTANGYRLLQMVQPVSVFQAEVYIKQWLKSLEIKGHDVDWGCRDWSRMFRLPNVRRDGKPYKSPYLDISRMSVLTLDVLELEEEEPGSEHKETVYYSLVPEWSDVLSEKYDSIAKTIAQELCKIQDIWHPIFLAIAGALESRQVPIEVLPAFCYKIAYYANDSRQTDRYNCGKTTGTKRYNKIPTIGLKYLYTHYPELANCIDVAFGVVKPKPAVHAVSSIDVVYEEMKERIRTASPGITLLKATVGLGKTRSSLEVAIERDEEGLNTAISLDKNILAQQVANDIKKEGIDSYRVFGALSLKDEEGNPICIHHETAQPLADGGQSISLEFCNGRSEGERCEMFETCQARLGFEGVENSSIMVGNHNTLTRMIDHVGKKGLIIVDEPKNFVVTHKITKKNIERLAERLDRFEYGYMRHAKTYLEMIIGWQDPKFSFEDMTRDVDLSPIKSIENNRRKVGVPPIKRDYVMLLRKNKEASEELGRLSKIIYLFYRAKTEKSIVELQSNGSIDITLYDEDMFNVLNKGGPVVITDATPNSYVDKIEAITGNKPEIYEFEVEDTTTTRTIFKVNRANRTNWIAPNGKVLFKPDLLDCFRWICEWHKEGRSLGIITFFPIEKAIIEKDPSIPKEFLDIVSSTAHYYNIKGMNDMMDLDELVTLGDPWANRDAIKKELIFHGITESKEGTEIKLAQDQLVQCHGRLRSIRRTKPGYALHVGSVTPSGFGWDKAARRTPKPGKSLIAPPELIAIAKSCGLTQTKIAELFKVSQGNVSRILSGKQNITFEQAAALKEYYKNNCSKSRMSQ